MGFQINTLQKVIRTYIRKAHKFNCIDINNTHNVKQLCITITKTQINSFYQNQSTQKRAKYFLTISTIQMLTSIL